MPIYQLVACPTLYSGQRVECRLESELNGGAVTARLFASIYDERDELVQIHADAQVLADGSQAVLVWQVPETHAYPIFEIGIEIEALDPLGVDGTLYLDYLTWSGAPDTVLKRPDSNLSTMWKHAWVNNVSQFQTRWEGLRVTNGNGLGFIAQGSRDWRDYRVTSEITPLLANAWGLAARVQGRERYYAVMFDRVEGGRVRLVKRVHDEIVLASEPFAWQLDRKYKVELRVAGTCIETHVDGKKMFTVRDTGELPLTGGAVALLVESGSISTEEVRVSSNAMLAS